MIGHTAQDLLKKLLVKDPHKRLGSGPRGAEDIKAHPFFKVFISPTSHSSGPSCAGFPFSSSFPLLPVPIQGLNWDDLAEKKVPSPFKPELKSELDVGNFAEEFTGMDPVYSPASTPPSTGRLFKVSPSVFTRAFFGSTSWSFYGFYWKFERALTVTQLGFTPSYI